MPIRGDPCRSFCGPDLIRRLGRPLAPRGDRDRLRLVPGGIRHPPLPEGTGRTSLQSRHGPSGLFRRTLPLSVGGTRARDLPDRRAAGALRRRPASVHAADPARERPAHEDGVTVTAHDVEAVAGWDAAAEPSREINYNPARVLLQDFTGVPAVVDLAAMRDAMADLGGDPQKINPLIPAELVIDHSVQVDDFAHALRDRAELRARVQRNSERYAFLRWGQEAFDELQGRPAQHRHRPPGQPRVPARVVEDARRPGLPRHARRHRLAHDDGQRARGARLGRRRDRGRGGDARRGDLDARPPGRRLPAPRRLPEGATATDLVLTVTQILRKTGVVGKFVEYFGHGLARAAARRPGHDREHVPGVRRDVRVLPRRRRDAPLPALTGRRDERIALVEAYCKQNGLWHDPAEQPTYSQVVELDLSTVEPSIAGPRRPQDRVAAPGRARRRSRRRCRPSGSRTERRRRRRDEPASDPTRATRPSARRLDARVRAAVRRRRSVDRRREGRARPRCRGHRCDHVLHEHLQSGGDDRGRPARQEGRRARPHAPALGEDESRPRLQGRDRVLREGRADTVPRSARLPHRRLRLHDVHRELGPAARTDLRGDHRRRPRRVRRSLREPELRGPRPSRGQGELPRLAPARRRVRARRADGRRHHDRAPRPRRRAGSPSSSRTSGRRRGGRRRRWRRAIGREMFLETYANVYEGEDAWRELRCRPGSCSSGTTSTYVRRPPYFDGMATGRGRDRRHPRGSLSSSRSVTR